MIYSGHGVTNIYNENFIVCGDGLKLEILEIQRKFCSDNCEFLANKPKIFYIDCCRGGQIMNNNDNHEQMKGSRNKAISTRYTTLLSDFYSFCNLSRLYIMGKK